MARWKYQKNKNDEYFSYDKIRRSKDKRRKKKDAQDSFVLDESSWEYQDGWFRARVVEVQKRYAFVAPEKKGGSLDSRDVHLGTIARTHLQSRREERNSVVVGDIVLCRPTDQREAEVSKDIPCVVIVNREDRSSQISRCDPTSSERKHVLASNVDQLIIVASYLAPTVKWGLIDRYLVLAEEQGIEATIVLNKEDLLHEEGSEAIEQAQREIATYKSLGYDVLSLSLLKRPNDPELDRLKTLLDHKISMVSGHSGVGKSSLVNLFDPEIVQEVEENADIFYKGRHTTTYASFISLGTGGYIIDTPGIRSFLLGDRNSIDLSFGFRELRDHVGRCKYRECRHLDEPGCSVLKALDNGEISSRRYQSYKGLLLGDTGREGRVRD